MSIRGTRLAITYFKIIENRIIPFLASLQLHPHPNSFTLVGAGFALFVPPGFYFHPSFGLIFLLLSGILDTFDGLMARVTQKTSTFGAFLDSTTDRVSDFLYLLGFWILFWKSGQHLLFSGLVIFSAFLFTLLISYTKARIEALGGKCGVGLMSRAARVLYLLGWALILSFVQGAFFLWAGLVIYWLLTLGTVLQRVQAAWHGLDNT